MKEEALIAVVGSPAKGAKGVGLISNIYCMFFRVPFGWVVERAGRDPTAENTPRDTYKFICNAQARCYGTTGRMLRA